MIDERVTRVLSNCYFHAIRLKGIRFEVETRSHQQMSQNNEIQYLSIFLDLLQPLSWWITRVRPDEHYPFIVSSKFLMLDVSRKYVISKKKKRKKEYGNSHEKSQSVYQSLSELLELFVQSINSQMDKFLYIIFMQFSLHVSISCYISFSLCNNKRNLVLKLRRREFARTGSGIGEISEKTLFAWLFSVLEFNFDKFRLWWWRNRRFYSIL